MEIPPMVGNISIFVGYAAHPYCFTKVKSSMSTSEAT